jgi:hypothetical protein
LSHHATVFIPHRWRTLQRDYGPVHTAKVFGLFLLAVGFVALIVGASVRSVKPWFSPDDIFRNPLTNGGRPSPSTFEDVHALCQRSVADWSLVQLAAVPILAEARRDYPDFYRNFSRHLRLPLLEDDVDFQFDTSSLFVFERATGRFLAAPPHIPFVDNYGIYFENQLSSYYGGVIDDCVPLYGVATKFFLQNLLPTPSEAVTTAIVGPSRLTLQWLNNATLSVKQELEVIYQIMDAFGLTAERPVFVGHGAAGLIV